MWPWYPAHRSSHKNHGLHLLKTNVLEMNLQDDEDELSRSLFLQEVNEEDTMPSFKQEQVWFFEEVLQEND